MTARNFAQEVLQSLTKTSRTVTVNWVHDEQVDIQIDGGLIFTATHDEHGWDGMQAVITLATELAGRLGATVETAGTPNLQSSINREERP